MIDAVAANSTEVLENGSEDQQKKINDMKATLAENSPEFQEVLGELTGNLAGDSETFQEILKILNSTDNGVQEEKEKLPREDEFRNAITELSGKPETRDSQLEIVKKIAQIDQGKGFRIGELLGFQRSDIIQPTELLSRLQRKE